MATLSKEISIEVTWAANDVERKKRRPGDVGIGDEAQAALLAPFEVLLGIMNRRRRRNACEPIGITARSSVPDQI